MPVYLSPLGGAGAQFCDSNGNPLSGGKLYTYAAGTTTPLASYTTSTGNTAHTNPIILDSAGRVPSGGEMWWTSATYKVVLRTSADALVGTWDNLYGINPASTSNVGVSVLDYGAVGDGVTNDAPAVQAAINAVAAVGRGMIVFPPGRSYMLNTQINVCDNLTVWGYGARLIAGRAWANIDAPLFKNFTATKMSIPPGTITATKNIHFYGFEGDGQDVGAPSGVPNANMHGIFICMGNRADTASAVDGFVVQDCYLHNMDGAGIMTYGGKNVNVSNNILINFFPNNVLSIGSGILLVDADGFVVNGNLLDHTSANWSWHGITIVDSNLRSKNGTVSNNIIRNMNQGDGVSCEGNSLDNISNVTFTGNSIYNCIGDGIGVDRGLQAVVSGNTISDVGGVGVLLGQTERVIITNNSILNCGSTAIYGSGDKAVITGNSITGTAYVNSSYQGDGIFLVPTATSNSNSALVAGNYFKDIAGCAIVAQQNTVISGNFVFNAGMSASAGRRQGIIASADSIVTGNTVYSNGLTSYGIACNDNPCTMRDNQLLGTFTAGKVFVGYRGATYIGMALNQSRIEMDGKLGTITLWDTAAPATGRWVQGDMVYQTAPVSAGWIGWVCTALNTWRNWGLIG